MSAAPMQGVPAIRFRGFTGEWIRQPISPFIEEFCEKSTVQDQHEVLTSSRGGLVRQRDYYDNERITDRNNIGFNIIPQNYLTYRSRSDDRQFFFNENTLGITGITSIYYPVFKIVDGDDKFFIHLFSRYTRELGKHSVGTSQTVLSLSALKQIKLPIPLVAEQKKIAAVLGAVDEKLARIIHEAA